MLEFARSLHPPLQTTLRYHDKAQPSSDQGPTARPTCAAAAMWTAEPGVVYGLEVGERDPLLLVTFCENASDEPFRYAAWLLQSALYKNGFKRDCIEYTDEENIWRPSNEHEVANELTTRRIFRCHSHCRVARIMENVAHVTQM